MAKVVYCDGLLNFDLPSRLVFHNGILMREGEGNDFVFKAGRPVFNFPIRRRDVVQVIYVDRTVKGIDVKRRIFESVQREGRVRRGQSPFKLVEVKEAS